MLFLLLFQSSVLGAFPSSLDAWISTERSGGCPVHALQVLVSMLIENQILCNHKVFEHARPLDEFADAVYFLPGGCNVYIAILSLDGLSVHVFQDWSLSLLCSHIDCI
jgi:hypothetical protein